MGDIVIRFILGGLIVVAFAVIGEVVQPKSFAGIFGAAPSVALATLGLTVAMHGGPYAALEGRSMLIGAVALLVYSALLARLLLRDLRHPLLATCGVLASWLVVAFGGWAALLR